MTDKTWDPLQSSQDADAEILSAARKREIKNILKSYVGMYDSFSELIQNAMDAVDRRKALEQGSAYKGKLWLTVNLLENSFSITDNGIGFNEREFKSFLAPNISFKSGGGTRGNKGVGATYIGYGFDYLQFGTKGVHNFVGELSGGRTWVEDEKGVVTRPVVISSASEDKSFNEVDRGSVFKIKFGGDHTRPKDLSWYGASTPEQWLYLFLIKTPLGCINYKSEIDDSWLLEFDLSVVNKKGELSTLCSQNSEYIYPHVKIKSSVDLKDVIRFQESQLASGRDASVIPARFSKSNGVYEYFSVNDVLKLRGGVEQPDYEGLIKKYKIEAYGYFAYSTSLWDQFNDSLAKLRKGYRVLKGGLQLANNRMVQGELMVIPLTSNIGYQNQCHIVVHFKDADPDLGRKGFQPELKDVAEKIAIAVVNRLKKWKKLLKSDTGVKPDIAKEVALYDWIRLQEEHEQQCPLILNGKNFFNPVKEISISSEPQSEQDVIVLFNQLLAGGVIRGIKLLSTSQVKQYDGIYKYSVKEPFSNHEFDKDVNPLGVEQLSFKTEHVSPPKILEYKYSVDALMQEFEIGDKIAKDINLVVAWEVGDEWRKNYDIISLLDLDNLHQRDFHGLTHVFDSGTIRFYAVILKELVAYLNDVDGVQSYHKENYGGDFFE